MNPTNPPDPSLNARLQFDQVLDRFESAWRSNQEPQLRDFVCEFAEASRGDLLVELVQLDLEYRWRNGIGCRVEPYLADWPELRLSRAALLDLLRGECRVRLQCGDQPTLDEYHERFGELGFDTLRAQLAPLLLSSHPTVSQSGPGQTTPQAGAERSTIPSAADAQFPPDRTAFGATVPVQIGGYRIRGLLGMGGFGTVYRAEDPRIGRDVALKVARPDRVRTPEAIAEFFREAHAVAQLRHSHIVTVYHVGQENEHVYIVYELIDGMSLKERMRQHERMAAAEVARLVADVADALHHAHSRGLTHRDIKPANILLDRQGQAHVVDFGLALREADRAQERGRLVGTYPYMSPEQVRREGHRTESRSDIYSLGVVLYELLTGRTPFPCDSISELFDAICHTDPTPPRLLNAAVSPALENICLRAMAKRTNERYALAGDMAADLRLAVQPPPDVAPAPAPISAAATAVSAEPGPAPVVPKGLRAFGPEDAAFFLQLLPGPKDLNGLPDSIRFWKTRIESHDTDRAFRVGLLHGPSGCGKSSLVQAGLLPLLSRRVRRVSLEAAGRGSEERLRRALQHICPELDSQLGLPDAAADIRRGRVLRPDEKLLVVVDQFEQWLHGRSTNPAAGQLVAALRQADGSTLQFLLLVRDDFWGDTTRLFQEIEVEWSNAHNEQSLELFDMRHAWQVLRQFGTAYGCLAAVADMPRESAEFLDRAVRELAENDRVGPVWLSLFADLMRGHAWVPHTLREVGGPAGLGIRFLEDTFSSRSAGAKHHGHERAARAVLEKLLPDSPVDLKGGLRSERELVAASGYARQPARFAELMRLLDSELRLVTPRSPETASDGAAASVERSYQLTHDCMVRAVQEWLAAHQRRTWRGRARLRLADHARLWNVRPEPRFLPSIMDWAGIRLLTAPATWTSAQRRMMAAASRTHGWRVTFAGLLALMFLIAGSGVTRRLFEQRDALRASQLVTRLVDEPAAMVPAIVQELARYRRWADPRLREMLTSGGASARAQVRASVAMLPVDDKQIETLKSRLLKPDPPEFALILDTLKPHARGLVPELWQQFRVAAQPAESRFRLGLALATFDPEAPQWQDADAKFLVDRLLAERLDDQRELRAYLRPIRGRLLPVLDGRFADPSLTAPAQSAIAGAVAEFARDEPHRLARLASMATPEQIRLLAVDLLESPKNGPRVRDTLADVAGEHPAATATAADRVQLGRRRATAACLLLRLGDRETALGVLRATDDPEAITQFAHRARDLGVTADTLIGCLDPAREPSVRHALLLALGEFDPKSIADETRTRVVGRLVEWYARDPSSAVHGAAGWLLRYWGFERESAGIDQTAVAYDATGQRDWFVERVGDDYFTFVVFRPGESVAGSPEAEDDREASLEMRHAVRFTRAFAIADREVTYAEFLRYRSSVGKKKQEHPRPQNPAGAVSWSAAVAYCRWLTTTAGLPEGSQAHETPETFLPDRLGFRLPTEAEWERACRAGVVTAWSFGNDPAPSGRYAWYYANSRGAGQSVGRLRPNLRGLFDMHGNAIEWCYDWYAPYGGEPVVQDPTGPATGQMRVARGGQRGNDSPRHSRCAARTGIDPKLAIAGFRIARTLP
jgi:formylglycine-generating enzyme required for sulfatase activity/predicted Ser/Thr protein kinase